MSRVNIESRVWTDLRFKKLASILNISLAESVGLMAMVWHQCTQRAEQEFTKGDLNLLTDKPTFADALVQSQLGRQSSKDDRVYLSGSQRCLWIEKYKNGYTEGGKSRASKAQRNARGRFEKLSIMCPAPVQHGEGYGHQRNAFPASNGPAKTSGPAAPTPTHIQKFNFNSINHHSEIHIRPKIEVPDDAADFLKISNKGGNHGSY